MRTNSDKATQITVTLSNRQYNKLAELSAYLGITPCDAFRFFLTVGMDLYLSYARSYKDEGIPD